MFISMVNNPVLIAIILQLIFLGFEKINDSIIGQSQMKIIVYVSVDFLKDILL